MPRLRNDAFFPLPDLQGAMIGELVGFEDDGANTLLLRLDPDDRWHRLFLDAGIGFWEYWTREEAFEFHEDLPVIDYAERWNLSGAVIQSAVCTGMVTDQSGLSEFHIFTDRGVISLRHSDPSDRESDEIITFRAYGSALPRNTSLASGAGSGA